MHKYRVGLRPVRQLARVGEHIGCAEKKRSNRMPAAAMASRFGVFSSGCPL